MWLIFCLSNTWLFWYHKLEEIKYQSVLLMNYASKLSCWCCEIKPPTNELWRGEHQFNWRDWNNSETGGCYLSYLGKKISTIMDVFFKQPNSKKKNQIITVLFYEKKYFYTLSSVLLITKNWCCFCSNIMNMFFFHFWSLDWRICS